MDSFSLLVGRRIRLAREAAKLSQERLTHSLGFNDRQTLSTIESGQRRVSPDELVRFAKVLAQPIDFFTDPYRVTGACEFSYRATDASPEDLQSFESQAGRLIGARRRFQELLGRPPSPVLPQISTFGPQASLEFATVQGERCAAAWQLGAVPCHRLRDAVTETLGVVVLHVDAPTTVSGAACVMDDGAYILINRRESVARQNFDLGHELFHVLTWNAMRPERVERVTPEGGPGSGRSKVEKLADAFTAGLLMPGATVRNRWESRGDRPHAEWLRSTAMEFGVSPVALFWRMVNLRLLKGDSDELRRLVGAGPRNTAEERPALYSRSFVADLHAVLEGGLVTVRRVLNLLDLDKEELKALFEAYNLAAPFDL